VTETDVGVYPEWVIFTVCEAVAADLPLSAAAPAAASEATASRSTRSLRI
jgi:hypothetical protein